MENLSNLGKNENMKETTARIYKGIFSPTPLYFVGAHSFTGMLKKLTKESLIRIRYTSNNYSAFDVCINHFLFKSNILIKYQILSPFDNCLKFRNNKFLKVEMQFDQLVQTVIFRIFRTISPKEPHSNLKNPLYRSI